MKTCEPAQVYLPVLGPTSLCAYLANNFFFFFFFFFIVMFTSQYANRHVDGCRNRPEGRQDRSCAHPDHVTSSTKPSLTKGPSLSETHPACDNGGE